MNYYICLVDFTLKQLSVFQDILLPIKMRRIQFYERFLDCYIDKSFFEIWEDRKVLEMVLKVLKNNHIEIWNYSSEGITLVNTKDKGFVIHCYHNTKMELRKIMLLLNTYRYSASIISSQRWGTGYLTIIKLDRLLEKDIIDILQEKYDFDTFLSVDKKDIVYQIWC